MKIRNVLNLIPGYKWASGVRKRKQWLKYNWYDKNRPIKEGEVNVYYYKRPNQIDNVGDMLSPIVVDMVKEHLNLQNKKGRTERMFAIGSVITAAKSDMVIWGSGVHFENSIMPKVDLDIRAVRGPLSKEKLVQNRFKCPEYYGDPALLLPLFYQPNTTKQYDYTIIAHFSKDKEISDKYKENQISTLTSDWKGFIDRLASSKYVISGSLHGIIIAEAYGVPAILLDLLDGDMFKYKDYYYSTGRKDIIVAKSVEEALKERKSMPPIGNLEKLQSDLIQSFPKDLWE
ncbi:polysaccharide pyruvyl transferase family protein [Pedobacter chinensis]|uniref:Polysaccharide pyruvyl transferase family protein n=1 Tax=Pedobacter chinensis TaxID=2282421 RepID=A0A369PSK9_9SPHI|nr:polysaccharide pyruvyl transferase family protein [Pedobacter chinensis]RDC54265.1 polysaccharide pyruvyl transferase family protein [Pedobacter chinensis]